MVCHCPEVLPLLLTAALAGAAAPGQDRIDPVDPAVERALSRGRPVPVVLLCRSQLLDTPGGFATFCQENAAGKRSELRSQVIEDLRRLADEEQPAVLKALGDPSGAIRLWIVNAIAVVLSPEQVRKAAALDGVAYVYPGQRLRPRGRPGTVAEVLRVAPREPFSTDGKRVPWNLKRVRADRVWSEHQITGAGATVAMLDSGTNYRHADLRGNVWRNVDEKPNNGLDDDGNGYVDDLYGFDFVSMTAEVGASGPRQHGTWTAGIVAGDGTGGIVTGVAPRAKLMLLRGGGTVGALLAHQYALENGADVMNMSFSVPNLGHTRGLWRRMSEHAVCAGLVLVSGAGNFQRQVRTPVQQRIPEGIPCVISAGGLSRKLEVPPFCSLGPVEWGSVRFYEDHPMSDGGLVKPDVCGFPGPGFPLVGTDDEGYVDPNRNIQGNSFSGPHVAGAAALMLSADPDLCAWQVKEILEATAQDLGEKGKDNRTGAGLLDAQRAVEAAMDRAKRR